MRRGRRSLRQGVYAASVAVVLWAASVVPLPFIEYVPGTPTEIAQLIEFDGVDVGELDGSTALLTVTLREQPTLHALFAVLDDERELQRVDRIYPQDIERDDYLRMQRERFGRQFEIAAAVGARAAGYETEMITEVVVVNIVADGPADGRLRQGDVVVEANGLPIQSADQLQNLVFDQEVGDVVDLVVEADGQRRTESIRLGEVPGQDGPRIGIEIHTAVDELRLPFDVRLAEGTRIGGPSAGLMIGLTVYDLLADEDLLAGRTVMGTGSLDSDGSVGAVGGVPEKMRAARDHGVDVVFVAYTQQEVAQAAAPDLQIVGVRTLDEALEFLRDG